MQNNIELELLLRPAGGTVVSLIAQRLQTRLIEERSTTVHDHRVVRDDTVPSIAPTVAPVGQPGWTADTGQVWNRVEWTERHGTLPAAFELRVMLPTASDAAMRTVAGNLSRFIAQDLNVPVTWSLIDAEVPWPLRTSLVPGLRLCFPTRVLPGGGQPSVVDRSGQPSGFGGRLLMVANIRVMKQFEHRVGMELQRLMQAASAAAGAVSRAPMAPNVGIFSFPDGPADGKAVPLRLAPDISAVTHPHVARLQREGPRGQTVMELREFDVALGFARTVEDALRDVLDKDRQYDECGERQTRLQSQLLDHAYLLDRARQRRASSASALAGLQDKKVGLIHFAKGRMELASLARERHHRERTIAHMHVQELKASIARMQDRVGVGVHESTVARAARDVAQDELRIAVKSLHAADPRVLSHLMGFLTGKERACLKAAMAKAVPVEMPAGGLLGDAAEDTRAGPPAKPSRTPKP